MRTLISALIVFCFLQTKAQNPYYDAISLQKLLIPAGGGSYKFETTSQADQENWAEILGTYTDGVNSEVEPDAIKLKYCNNPYIKEYFVCGGSLSTTRINTLAGTAISSLGGVDVTNIADGLAKFLVERTKKELSMAFFEQFKEDLEEFEELKVLFPKTHSLLLAMDQEIYNFSGYVNMLRETFQEDLQNSISNLRNLMTEVDRMKSYLSANPTMGFILYNSLLIAEELQNGEHPGDILTTLKDNGQYTQAILNFNPSVETLDLFSQSLRSKQAERYWITPDSLKLLIEEEATFMIYLGLIYEQVKTNPIIFTDDTGNEISLLTVLDDIGRQITINRGPFKTYLKGIVDNAKLVDQKLKYIKRKKDENTADYAAYYAFYNSSIDFMKQIASIDKIPAFGNNISYDSDKVGLYFDIAYTAGDLYLDVNEKRYYSAVLNLNVILEKVVPNCNPGISSSDNDLACGYAQKVLPKILKYGNLAASLAEAESSDDAQAIIEAVALPAGSSSIKRRADRTFSLNAYVGLSAGGAYNTLSYNWAFETGIIAPVGAEVSWGRDNYNVTTGKIDKKASFSIFMSIVDIGAVTTYRFGDEETSEVPTITFENIFSPGVFFILGFKDKPVSLGIGGQANPRLHKVNVDGNMVSEGANLALKAFLAVDIPLLNLKSTPKRD